VDYVVELGRRYEPAQISVTELFLDRYTFGDDDLALYREMTGAQDWPRDESGAVEEDAPALGSWRSDVLAGLLTRMRTGLDEVQRGDTARVALSMEVRVDWDDLARGVPSSGHDYEVLLTAVDRLTVWAYFQPSGRDASRVEALTAALAGAGFDMSRITVSVGLWAGSSASTARISPEVMARAATLAATNGVRAVNVTPLSFMTDEHWSALASVWHPDAGEDETP